MEKIVDRRKFLALAAGTAALGALVVLQGCSSGSGSADTTPTTPTEPTTSTYTDKNATKVSSNHGHSYTLTAAQQEAGAEVTIYSKGGDHSHKLKIAAADVAAIAAGTTWSGEDSLTSGHTHIVTFN